MCTQYQQMLDDVVTPLQAIGVVTTIHVGEMGFQAVGPAVPTSSSEEYYSPANETYQAGMAVRWFSTWSALGAGSAIWFTHTGGASDTSDTSGTWGKYQGMGLHGDTYDSADTANPTYSAAAYGYRRPIWYALRRLNYLLSQCDSSGFQVYYADRGAVVITMQARSTFRFSDGDGGTVDTGLQFGAIAWVDEFADEPDTVYATTDAVRQVGGGISLYYDDLATYQIVSVVPLVIADPTDTDANGYEATDAPFWPPLGVAAPAVPVVSVVPASTSATSGRGLPVGVPAGFPAPVAGASGGPWFTGSIPTLGRVSLGATLTTPSPGHPTVVSPPGTIEFQIIPANPTTAPVPAFILTNVALARVEDT